MSNLLQKTKLQLEEQKAINKELYQKIQHQSKRIDYLIKINNGISNTIKQHYIGPNNNNKTNNAPNNNKNKENIGPNNNNKTNNAPNNNINYKIKKKKKKCKLITMKQPTPTATIITNDNDCILQNNGARHNNNNLDENDEYLSIRKYNIGPRTKMIQLEMTKKQFIKRLLRNKESKSRSRSRERERN